MIRYAYICNQVLQLYKKLPSIKFPLDPRLFFEQMDNCKTMTYNKFAELNQCSLQEVFALCESKSGCTHYDVGKNRYLVLFNSSRENHNVLGRIRWTLAHELGHVTLNHLPYIAEPHIAEIISTICPIQNLRPRLIILLRSCYALCLCMKCLTWNRHRIFNISLACHGRLLTFAGMNTSNGNAIIERPLGKTI